MVTRTGPWKYQKKSQKTWTLLRKEENTHQVSAFKVYQNSFSGFSRNKLREILVKPKDKTPMEQQSGWYTWIYV